MKHFTTLILLAILAVTVVPVTPVHAQNQDRERRGDRDRDNRGNQDDRGNRNRDDRDNRGREDRGGGMSLDQAVAMVERRFKAKVVRTEVRQDGDRKIYVLRLLNDEGRVWSVRVDSSSGSVQ